MKIRYARLGDEKGIANVHVKSWQSAYRSILPEQFLKELSPDERRKRWEASLQRTPEEHGVFVVENEVGEITGFAATGKSRFLEKFPQYEAELYAIYLLPSAWGKGIGEKLVQEVITHVKTQNMNSMLVWVLADNPAKKFYERLGGKFVSEDTIKIAGKEYKELAYGWERIV